MAGLTKVLAAGAGCDTHRRWLRAAGRLSGCRLQWPGSWQRFWLLGRLEAAEASGSWAAGQA